MFQQRKWAESIGLVSSARGYLATVEENLFQQLSKTTKKAFDNGSGSELKDTLSRPAKMKALHSSSALAVNFFDYWVDRDLSVLSDSLGLQSKVISIKFEEQFPTGLIGNPPNLDVVLELQDKQVIGIESKFSEWLTPKSKSAPSFKAKYFSDGQKRWKNLGLPEAQKLAEAIYNGEETFVYLNAPQLLKHALGMATKLGNRFSLIYIYFDWDSAESALHRQEIDRFAALIDEVLGFKAMSYQKLFSTMNTIGNADEQYISYLSQRYFNSKAD
jgi:hypothetical protein